MREQWFATVERSAAHMNMLTFRDWLQQKASIHERLLVSNSNALQKSEKFEKVKKHTSCSAIVARKEQQATK